METHPFLLATGEHLFSISRLRWETLAGGGMVNEAGKI